RKSARSFFVETPGIAWYSLVSANSILMGGTVMSNILVAYFSASGVTAKAAEAIAKAVGGDLYEIIPQAPYTAADLNWNDKHSRSSGEMQDEQSRPALAAPVKDLSAYDTVFVGFPIWWGVEPRVVDTFLDQAGLSG